MKSIISITRFCAFFCLTSVSLLAGCAVPNSVNPAQGARLDLVLNEVKKQIADIGQYDIKYSGPSSSSCGTVVQAFPGSAVVTLKTATTTTVSASGAGSVPVSYVVITPSLSGSYSNAQTETVSFNTDVDRTTLPPPQRILASVSGPATADLQNEHIPNLKTAVIGVLQGFVNADHTLKPCLKPQKLTIQADFQVSRKADGGIQINFIVAKIGGDVAVTSEATQSVAISMNLEGTYGKRGP